MKPLSEIEQTFVTELRTRGIELSDEQCMQFRIYFEMLVEWNQKMNLTGITDELGVYTKHFLDSISLAFFVPMKPISELLDIGPGAGFPGIPLKIVFPHLRMSLVETIRKRVTFMNAVIERLNLSNIVAVHARAEELAHAETHRGKFDLVTARAVSNLSTLVEVASPYLKKDGQFVSLKGPDVSAELFNAKNAISQLRVSVHEEHQFELPGDLGKRTLIVFKSNGTCPAKYPRKQGLPFNKPL